jgi:1-hydroxycarotenoid 3,4-desaturase
MPSKNKVIVVGAGMGGLVSALLLALNGLEVTVVEQHEHAGGKMRQIDGVDSGPTVFTMRWILEQIFCKAGTSLAERLDLYQLDTLARHTWRPERGEQAKTLDLYASHERTVDAIGAFSGLGEARRFESFCTQARRIYQTLEGPYIRSERPSFLGLTKDLGVSGLSSLASLGPFASLWKNLGKQFQDQRLQQLFGRYATYCGASPWQAPATLMLIADVEMQGVWGVTGGMSRVAQVLAELAQEKGVNIRYRTCASELLVKNSRVCGLKVFCAEKSEFLDADTVIFNGDVSALSQGFLGDAARSAVPTQSVKNRLQKRSLSAVTYSMHAKTDGLRLAQHNVFFTSDYKQEFADVFEKGRLPRAGTVYLCAQDRNGFGVKTNADSAQERLLLLVNAPAVGDLASAHDVFNTKELEQCSQTHFNLLRECGLTIDLSSVTVTTPIQFNQLFPGTGGALYGQASHGWMNQFERMGATTRIPGLYLAGGSVHPGPGVPMAAMSGQLAAETVMANLGSTKKSGRVVIAGGISTRSAIAVNTV